MSLAAHEPTTSTNTRNEDIDVIVTASGGEDMPRAAYRGGALVGIESTKKRPPEEIPIEFVDWPFLTDDPSFEDHLDVVKREKPKYAVAPDIQDAENYHEVLSQARALDRHAETVIVVPKGVKPDKVPDRFRVGLPAQDRFGGVPWPVWDYRNCESVHILGGSPNRQNELSHYVAVDSVDTASPLKAAQFGNVWNGKWSEAGHNYYDRIERSMGNLLREWNERVNEDRVNLCRLEVEQPDPCPLPDERKARPRSREQICIGGDEETPFPGREYFYRDDTLSYSEWLEEYRDSEPGWVTA